MRNVPIKCHAATNAEKEIIIMSSHIISFNKAKDGSTMIQTTGELEYVKESIEEILKQIPAEF